MAHLVVAEFWLEPSRLDEALEALHRALADTRAFDGCLQVDVLAETADPAHLVVAEHWASPEHVAAYRKWRAGDGKLTDLAPLMAASPVSDRYTHQPAI